jgi:hypothetical protein
MKRWIVCFGFVVFLWAWGAGSGQAADPVLAGNWTGHGAGEEVRFRDPNGLLVLTVKHRSEFVFHVNEQGEIEGEGTVEYDLERNTTGLDNLVASVHALMALAPTPGVLPGGLDGGAKQKVAEGMGSQVRDVPGVTKIQYDAPHLKYGKEIRHFKFTGHVERGTSKILLYLDVVTNFTLPDGKPDNTLVAEYEVNRKKYESTFPCWSPFLKAPAVVRVGPGGIGVAEFIEKGEHRDNKQVWQEYGYVWLARRIAPAPKQTDKKE